jgi:2,4-dienoyl-CoA reductase-like NADH-dependent reductase (Old Yellow Enzyme family)
MLAFAHIIFTKTFFLIVHGGFGYLIHQFLDSTSYQRTDSYGGSVANRARFALEALEVAVNVFGPKRVAIKLVPAGGGNDVG